MDGRDFPRFTSPEHPSMMVAPNSYASEGGVQGHSMLMPNSGNAIPGGMRVPLSSSTSTTPKPVDASGPIFSSGDGVLGMKSGDMFNIVEPTKKKRGRPRKYGPDGSMALALCSMSSSEFSNSSLSPTAKRRGRPPGSGRKQQLDALGAPGTSFTPHLITIEAGEDVASKIMAFSQQGPRTVCIISANGAICNVTLRQPASSGGTVTYEGRFEIISLSGSFLLTENDGTRRRTGGLSVALAGSDGRVLGGGVAGMLMAASPVQVVVVSFIVVRKKQKPDLLKQDPSSAPTNVHGFGAPSASSPTSPQGSSSGPDDEQGSPIDHDTGSPNNSVHHFQGLQPFSVGWPLSRS
ncbi:hypothetical protein HPP92_026880 [Vanilla planifolia]|uniref:AT-hook motif nuclear-localized protein n=1 Tax=Vanilla planifolia TaxID=51239 RepID=A0A835PD62_VANPL|nr:hypothetical protein HPP92_026880 [Vanilla planifolia]KAG0484901.1 hypothetical protein HPP92_008980 [Vanilla planifolia]